MNKEDSETISTLRRNVIAAGVELDVEPGFHYNIDFNEYLKWDAINNSTLNYIKRSPAHLQWYKENPRLPTPAMRLGKAIHAAVLEPKKFSSRFVVMPKINCRTNAGKEEKSAFEAANATKTILTQDGYEKCQIVSESAWDHPAVSELLEALNSSTIELSILWRDENRDINCKARIDGYISNKGICVDLKSSRDASYGEFSRSILKYFYHRQAAFYISGLKALGKRVSHFCFIVLETTPPYIPVVYRLSDDAITAADITLNSMLDRYAECLRNDRWPGYAEDIKEIDLPDWGYKQIEKETK